MHGLRVSWVSETFSRVPSDSTSGSLTWEGSDFGRIPHRQGGGVLGLDPLRYGLQSQSVIEIRDTYSSESHGSVLNSFSAVFD